MPAHTTSWQGAPAGHHHEDYYGQLTRAHRVVRPDPGSGAEASGTLGQFVRDQLAQGEGTCQFQRWVRRTARHLGIVR